MDEKTIDALCEKFHTTIDNLIPAYSHYMIHKDIGVVVLNMILMIISIIVILLVAKKAKESYGTDFYNWDFHHIITIIICGAIILTASTALFLTIYDLTLWITSPEMRFLDVIANSK